MANGEDTHLPHFLGHPAPKRDKKTRGIPILVIPFCDPAQLRTCGRYHSIVLARCVGGRRVRSSQVSLRRKRKGLPHFISYVRQTPHKSVSLKHGAPGRSGHHRRRRAKLLAQKPQQPPPRQPLRGLLRWPAMVIVLLSCALVPAVNHGVEDVSGRALAWPKHMTMPTPGLCTKADKLEVTYVPNSCSPSFKKSPHVFTSPWTNTPLFRPCPSHGSH